MTSALRGRLAVAVAILATTLTACGDDQETGSGPAAVENPHAAGSSSGPSVVSPCEALPAAEAGRLLGTAVAAAPDERDVGVQKSCSYAPEDTDSGVSLDVTSLYFDGDFEEAWAKMADRVQGRVVRVEVPGADAARLVVQPQRKALLVTGFVQHGEQVDTANLVDLSPESPAAVRATMRTVLTRLVEASG